MIETRTYKIRSKVFKIVDVKKIAHAFEEKCRKVVNKKHHVAINFKIICSDGSEYETEDSKLFDKESIINSKRIKKLAFSFVDYKDDKRIMLELEHGDYDYNNQLSISGSESNWVNGTLTTLKELIDSTQPQSLFFKKISILFLIISSFSIGIFFTSILIFIARTLVNKQYINPLKLLVDEPQAVLPFIFIVGFFPANYITDWLKKMWPNIEIQIGPDHTFFEKNRRELLWGIITLIILPIFVNLFIN